MKIVVLDNDAVIDDVFYRKGQVARVPDDFNHDIRRVLVTSEESAARVKAEKDKVEIIKNQPKKKPLLTWKNPADITVDTPLGNVQLNATADTAGKFVYEPPSGTILAEGKWDLLVTFYPADSNYETATATVKITVGKKPKAK